MDTNNSECGSAPATPPARRVFDTYAKGREILARSAAARHSERMRLPSMFGWEGGAHQAPSPIVLELPTVTPRRVQWWGAVSFFRARLWGLLFGFVTDGVTTFPNPAEPTVGRPLARRPGVPSGPLIVVTNHASHADSAILAATFGRDRPMKFAAAADYWLGSLTKKWAGSALIGLWPIRRTEGGWDDLRAAGAAIDHNVILVVFPEGTRTRDGDIGRFHKGAFRLAAATGAHILPVALNGTRELFPANGHGAYQRVPINVRWGEPMSVAPGAEEEAADAARATIESLHAIPSVVQPGWGWARTYKMATAWTGLAFLFLWAVAEGISWPFLAELPLALFVVTVGWSWRGPALIAATALGSVCGIATTWWLVTHGHIPPTPLTTPRMHALALTQMRASAFDAFRAQMFNGIPVKVYAAASGEVHVRFASLLVATLPRVARIALIGTVVWILGGFIARWLKPCLGVIQVTCLVIFPVLLIQVVRSWS